MTARSAGTALSAVAAVAAAALLAATSAFMPSSAPAASSAGDPTGTGASTPAARAPLALSDIAGRTWVLTKYDEVMPDHIELGDGPPVRLRLESSGRLTLDAAIPVVATARIEPLDPAEPGGDRVLVVKDVGGVATAACAAPEEVEGKLHYNPCLIAVKVADLLRSGPRAYLQNGDLALAQDDTQAIFTPEG